MNLEFDQSVKLVTVAGIVAIIALIILFLDLNIKRSILREAASLKEVISGNGSGRGAQGSSQADSGVHFRHSRGDSGNGSAGPGRTENLEDAPGGGIRQAPVIYGPAGRAYLNGDRTEDGDERILPSVRPVENEG